MPEQMTAVAASSRATLPALSIDVVAAVNDEATLNANLRRSPMLQRAGASLYLQRQSPSAAIAYNAAMRRSNGDVVVFVHQDVYLPADWDERLLLAIAKVEAADADWAVLGLFGATSQGRRVGRVWSSGLGTMLGSTFDQPIAVESIDEVLIVVRRGAGLEFDEQLPGFHLYGTDIVQSARLRGLGCYVICAPVIHNSRPCRFLDRAYFASYAFMARKWRQRLPIKNNVADIVAPGLAYGRLRARHLLNSVRYWRRARAPAAGVRDCVDLARHLGLE